MAGVAAQHRWKFVRVGGLDQSMDDAVTYKFIAKPLTKEQLDDLFKYAAK